MSASATWLVHARINAHGRGVKRSGADLQGGDDKQGALCQRAFCMYAVTYLPRSRFAGPVNKSYPSETDATHRQPHALTSSSKQLGAPCQVDWCGQHGTLQSEAGRAAHIYT